MNKAQVYIATTKGLVQIQSISALFDPDLQSVVSINKTSTLAKISTDYQSFVQKPQGLIHEVFGNHAYRLNISSQIDQGASWQLGVFLAHALAQHEALLDAHNDVTNVNAENSESNSANVISEGYIFIATGRIDTVNYQVLSIEGLPQKCISANAQISHWLKEGRTVNFFVPNDSLRQPLPDTCFNLTPVQSLEQIDDFLVSKGFVEGSVLNKRHVGQTVHENIDFINTDVDTNLGVDTNIDNDETNKPAVEKVENAEFYLTQAISHPRSRDNNEPLTHRHDEYKPSFTKALLQTRKAKLLLIAIVALLTTTVLWLKMPVKEHSSEQFQFIATISENRQLCRNNLDNQIEYTGKLSQTSSVNAFNLKHLCALSLRTYADFSQVWLLSESLAIVPLLKEVSATHNIEINWGIPLPADNINRQQYHILLFPSPVDEADKQSLQDYLRLIQVRHQAYSTQDIVAWSHIQNKPVFIINNELYKP